MIDVVGVQPLEDYRLLLTFEGGERRELDLSSFVSFDGVFEPLKDPAYFGRVEVNPDVGTIVWPNGADLCPDVLYERSRPVSSTAAAG